MGRSVHLPLWGRQDRDLWSDYVPISSSPNQAQRSHGVILPLVRLGEIRALGRRLAAYHAHPREAVAREWNYALKSRRQFELILKRRQRQGRGRCRRIATATLTATPEAALSRPATRLPTLLINTSGDYSRLLGRLSDSSKSPESSKRLRSAVPTENSEGYENSSVLIVTAMMSPAWVVPKDALASQARPANL